MAPDLQTTLHTMTVWSAAITGSLLAATWQGLILAASIALCLRALPRLTSAARSFVWLSAFLLVIGLHFAAFVRRPAAAARPSSAGLHAFGVHGPHVAGVHLSASWSLAIAGVWLVFSLARGAQFLADAARFSRIARAARPVACPPECEPLLAAGGRRAVLCTSNDVARPSLIGFRSPRILLPPALLATLSAGELEQVLLHEMEHLRRRDDWTNLAQKLALVVFPINPVLLWMEHRLCGERELACDDRVLRVANARKSYALCLTKLAEYSLVRRSAALALGAWERHSELTRRVQRILRAPDLAGMGGRAPRVTTGVLLAGLLGGAALLARSPLLVRFSVLPSVAQQAEVERVLPGRFKTASHADVQNVVFHPQDAHIQFAGMRVPERAAVETDAAQKQLPGATHRAATRAARKPHAHAEVQARSGSQVGTEKPHLAAARQNELPDAAFLVTTTWQGHVQISHNSPDEVHAYLLPGYAAVPVANGWLVIRL